MSNSQEGLRTCIITADGMDEGYLLHTGDTIKRESSLLVWLKKNHKEKYIDFDSKEAMYSDEFILADAYEQELYIWTTFEDEDEDEVIESGADQIENFMYFAYNYPMGWIQSVWGDGSSLANHIEAKWNNLNKRNGMGGTANFFNLYMELSQGNREVLAEYISINYNRGN